MAKQKNQLILMVIALIAGIYLTIMGAGSYFSKHETFGLFELAAGLIVIGLIVYKLLSMRKKS